MTAAYQGFETRTIDPSCSSGQVFQKEEIVISLPELEEFGKQYGKIQNYPAPHYLPDIEKQFARTDQLNTEHFDERLGEQRSANVAA